MPKKLSHSDENEHSIPLYIETNYSLCLYITECYYLPSYMHPYLKTLTRLSALYLNTCIAYLNTLSRLWGLGSISRYMHRLSQYIESAFGSRLHISKHASPILIHWVGFRLHISIHCRLVSAAPLAANQNQVLRHPSHQPIRIEHPSRHYVTRELSEPGRPFSALGSSRPSIAYLNAWGSPTPPPPPTWSTHTLTTPML